MAVQSVDLWTLTRGRPQIDPNDLAEAIAVQAGEPDLDYRTRLLIRDGVDALKAYWGEQQFQQWLAACPIGGIVHKICSESFERPGFPSLRRRLMERTSPEDIRAMLREVGTRLNRSVTIAIGGSVSLILTDRLRRKTDDIDIVDEVPKDIREQHTLLDRLQARYGLHFGHMQSHYLPSGWDKRLHSTETYGQIHASLVDPIDVFLGKLTSIREKDLDDLRELKPQFEKSVLVQRLKDTMASTLASAELRKRAQQNWYILFGEDLPQ